jgi:hypothetical protein
VVGGDAVVDRQVAACCVQVDDADEPIGAGVGDDECHAEPVGLAPPSSEVVVDQRFGVFEHIGGR